MSATTVRTKHNNNKNKKNDEPSCSRRRVLLGRTIKNQQDREHEEALAVHELGFTFQDIATVNMDHAIQSLYSLQETCQPSPTALHHPIKWQQGRDNDEEEELSSSYVPSLEHDWLLDGKEEWEEEVEASAWWLEQLYPTNKTNDVLQQTIQLIQQQQQQQQQSFEEWISEAEEQQQEENDKEEEDDDFGDFQSAGNAQTLRADVTATRVQHQEVQGAHDKDDEDDDDDEFGDFCSANTLLQHTTTVKEEKHSETDGESVSAHLEEEEVVEEDESPTTNSHTQTAPPTTAAPSLATTGTLMREAVNIWKQPSVADYTSPSTITNGGGTTEAVHHLVPTVDSQELDSSSSSSNQEPERSPSEGVSCLLAFVAVFALLPHRPKMILRGRHHWFREAGPQQRQQQDSLPCLVVVHAQALSNIQCLVRWLSQTQSLSPAGVSMQLC